MRTKCGILMAAVALFCTVSLTALALDASDLEQLLGYTMISASNVDGDFEGADFDKVVKLENGMIFQFTEYNYSYAYRPDVAVFAKEVTLRPTNAKGAQSVPKRIVIYKLVIDDDIYDVRRVR